MRNRKSGAELKGITLKQSILCLEHKWTGKSLKNTGEISEGQRIYTR